MTDRSGTKHPRNQPLRVGLLVDSFVQPKWVERCIDFIRRSDAAKISLVVVSEKPSADGPSESLLLRLYRLVDDQWFKTQNDPLDPANIATALSGVPRLKITTNGDARVRPGKAELEEIRQHDLDVILCFGVVPTGSAIHAIPRLGVWSYDFGEEQAPPGAPAGFAELAHGVVTDPQLVQETPRGRVPLYRSPTATNRASMAKTRRNVYFKAAAFAGRKLRDIRDSNGAMPPRKAAAGAQRTTPQGSSFNGFTRVSRRVMGEMLSNLTSRDQWVLGIRFRQPGDPSGPFLDLDDFTLIEPQGNHFWADPFPLEQDGRHFVFFEDYPYANRKGHLSVVEVDEAGVVGSSTEVLSTDFHLSFPNVFRHDGELYMLPETSQARQVQLYRCERFPDKWGRAATLLDNTAAVDPVVFQHDGQWWMFVGTREPGAGGSDEVSLFHAPRITGPWTPHRRNPVRSNVFSARPAGQVYELDGQLYRPAQDCSRRYGYGLVINRIDRVSETDYAETEVARLNPESRGFLGIHTVNHSERLTVVDFNRRQQRRRAYAVRKRLPQIPLVLTQTLQAGPPVEVLSGIGFV